MSGNIKDIISWSGANQTNPAFRTSPDPSKLQPAGKLNIYDGQHEDSWKRNGCKHRPPMKYKMNDREMDYVELLKQDRLKYLSTDGISSAYPKHRPGCQFVRNVDTNGCQHQDKNNNPETFVVREKQRTTNPLTPTYDWFSENHDHCAYPMQTKEQMDHRKVRDLYHNRYSNADISGTMCKKAYQRKDKYSNFDYSDVSGTAPRKQKHLQHQHQPVDNKKLGLWGQSGDTGRFTQVQSKREHSSPIDPSYRIYGQMVEKDDKTGASRTYVQKELNYKDINNQRRQWDIQEKRDGKIVQYMMNRAQQQAKKLQQYQTGHGKYQTETDYLYWPRQQ